MSRVEGRGGGRRAGVREKCHKARAEPKVGGAGCIRGTLREGDTGREYSLKGG